MSLALLRAEVWGSANRMHRVAMRYAAPALSAPVAVAHGRLVITGEAGHRLHEQLIFAAVRLDRSGGAPERLNVADAEAALAHATDAPLPRTLRDQVTPRLLDAAGPLRSALQARAGDRARTLTATLANRARDEQAHVAATLNELEATIRREAFGDDGPQLQLITDVELAAGDQRQVEQDLALARGAARRDPRRDRRRAGRDRPALREPDPPAVPRRGHAPRARRDGALMARARPTATAIDQHHAEWLSLVETSGPFLTVPALKRAMPNGLDPLPDAMADLRLAHAEWRDDPDLQQRWVRWVLDAVLGLADATTEATPTPTPATASPSTTSRCARPTSCATAAATATRPSCSCTATRRARRWTGRSAATAGPPPRSTAPRNSRAPVRPRSRW